MHDYYIIIEEERIDCPVGKKGTKHCGLSKNYCRLLNINGSSTFFKWDILAAY